MPPSFFWYDNDSGRYTGVATTDSTLAVRVRRTSRLVVSQAGGLKCPSSVTGENLAYI